MLVIQADALTDAHSVGALFGADVLLMIVTGDASTLLASARQYAPLVLMLVIAESLTRMASNPQRSPDGLMRSRAEAPTHASVHHYIQMC